MCHLRAPLARSSRQLPHELLERLGLPPEVGERVTELKPAVHDLVKAVGDGEARLVHHAHVEERDERHQVVGSLVFRGLRPLFGSPSATLRCCLSL